ncbi:MAG: mechanosensitive ion channel family protein [Halieaceae bacterium]|jgi:miniconductance mechanosensitive channel|nr:mechanosensitive ion channel family protein [Halieaceae bacterium]
MESLLTLYATRPDLYSLAGLLLVALAVYWFARVVLVRLAHRLALATAYTWDDALIQHGVPSRLAQLLPVFIIYAGVDMLPRFEGTLEALLMKGTSIYMVLVVTFAVTAALSAANTIYQTYPVSRQRPLKGFVQLLQLVVILFGLILAVSTLMDREPWVLLSGFGAMTAVLLLVFKDTILSLVASVQLTAQDLVRVGDWIEVPQFGADGDVIDVQLHTIKVQNWDKTITTIPTHRLISDSFRNWRGMSEAGGRRIKRCLYLDAASVRFLTEAEVDRFKRFSLLKDYMAGKQSDLTRHNAEVGDSGEAVNQRRLTNIGTFRAYVYNYLQARDDVHQGLTLLVRLLAPGPTGVPLEIYCFTRTTAWGEYEGIQGDIFDHLLAIVPEFGLRLYQQPSGEDVVALATLTAGAPARPDSA